MIQLSLYLPSGTALRPANLLFSQVLAKVWLLHAVKGLDYGTDEDPFANLRASTEWGVPAWLGALVRENDKTRRLQTFARRGTLANESVEDSLLDKAVYAILAYILFQEDQKGDSNA